jgi:AbrB family looped-hinge helix DNA binding protein
MYATVKVSSKYQIVIPKQIREPLNIKPGDTFGLLTTGKSLSLIKNVPLEALRGIAPGIDSNFDREREEGDRELTGEL